MVMTLDIPDTIVQQAEASGLSVETYLKGAAARLEKSPSREGFTRFHGSNESPSEAAASIREIASRNTLGGLNIKDLIDEGRRY